MFTKGKRKEEKGKKSLGFILALVDYMTKENKYSHTYLSSFLFPLSFFLFPLLIAAVVLANGSAIDADFVNSLREMRLYRLGKVYLTEKLEQSDLSDKDRSEIVASLITVIGEESLSVPVDKQAELTQEAQKIADEFLTTRTDSPYRIRVLMALLVNHSKIGELGAMNVQLQPKNESIKQATVIQLRLVESQAKTLLDIFDNPSIAYIPGSKRKAYTDIQWNHLKNQTLFLSAQGALNKALCYPVGSPEYMDGVAQANETLKLLGGLESTDELYWRSRLLRIQSVRMSGDYKTAQKMLKEIVESQKPPIDMLLDFQAEKLNILMFSSRSEGMLLLSQMERELGKTFLASDSLDDMAHLAVLNAFVTLEKEATARKDKKSASEMLTRAIQWAEKMQQYDSGFYARSAQQTLAALAVKKMSLGTGNQNESQIQQNEDDSLSNPKTMALAAENLFHSGQYQQAIDAYLKTAQAVKKNTQKADEVIISQQVFQYQYIAAAIAHKQNDHAQAMKLFRQVAIENPTNKQAMSAHKTALFHASKLIDNNKTETIRQYGELLDEFLKTFPDSPDKEQILQQRQRVDNILKEAPKTASQQLREAQSALESNQLEKALKLFESLASQFPNTADVQIGYARTLSKSEKDDKALTQWRTVVQKTKRYSDQWYEAKYEIARLLIKTGQKDKATEMIRLLKLLRPDLGGPEWKEKFENLLTN